MPKALIGILGRVPSTEQVLSEVVLRLGLADAAASAIESDFGGVLLRMMDEGLKILEHHQVEVIREVVAAYRELDQSQPAEAMLLITKGFSSITNQRKKRAGVHMERCLRFLLERCQIPAEIGTVISGHSDLIVPSEAVLKSRPERAIVLESKRTVRERWKQGRDEVARTGLKVWLVTLDDYISAELVSNIAKGNITLYVQPEVFVALGGEAGNLRSLNTLVEDLRAFVRVSAVS